MQHTTLRPQIGLHLINLNQPGVLVQPEAPIVSALMHSLGTGRSKLGQVNSDLKFPVLNKNRRLRQLDELQCLHRTSWQVSRILPSEANSLDSIGKNRPELLRTYSSSALNTCSHALR